MATKTSDLKQFKLLKENRKVQRGHVERIAKSIALFPDLLAIRPILVNERMEVIDGQHRLAACKKLGVDIYYEIGRGLDADEAVIINNNQLNWSILDYARSYAAQGKDAYQKLLDLHERYPTLPIYTILYYIGGSARNLTGINGLFRNGEFEATMAEFGEIYLEMLEDLTDITPKFGRSMPSKIMNRIFQIPEYDHDRMIKKLNMVGPDFVKLYGRAEDVLRNLEDIYNWRQQQDILRFY